MRGGLSPVVAVGPFNAVSAHSLSKFLVLDEACEGEGEVVLVAGLDEQAVLAVRYSFGDAADSMGDDGKAMSGRFEVDESEAFYAFSKPT